MINNINFDTLEIGYLVKLSADSNLRKRLAFNCL